MAWEFCYIIDKHYTKTFFVVEVVMTFEQFIKWAENRMTNWKGFQTLGGRSRFLAKYKKQQNSITVRNSRNREYDINTEALRRIFERYINAPAEMRDRAVYYTDPRWPETPNRVSAPYIPAVIRYWRKIKK